MSNRSVLLSVLTVAIVAAGVGSYALKAQGDAAMAAIIAESEFQGFGAATTGGAGGRIVSVTTLADSGEGSLRWALEDLTEKRIIHFDVSGVIELEDQIEIGSNVSVLGHTAPEGITITGSRLRVVGSNVILQGLRIRPGDAPGGNFENRDAISIGKQDVPIRNVVIDGNSLTWAVDENLSIWGDVTDVTLSNNIIAHALDESVHPKGAHSMGLLIGGGGAARVTVIGNLFAHNQNRNPAIKDDSQSIEVINNLIYNWGNNGMNLYDATINLQGNVLLPGADSIDRAPIALHGDKDRKQQTVLYIEDNVGDLRGSQEISPEKVFESSSASVMPSSQVRDWVLEHAGAREPALDPIDAAIIADVQNLTGRIINSPADLEKTDETGDLTR